MKISGYDILRWSPIALKAEYPDAEKVDWEKELEEGLKDSVSFEDFVRQCEEEESSECRRISSC